MARQSSESFIEWLRALNFGRELVAAWVREHVRRRGLERPRVLDLGVGQGWDLLRVRDALAPTPAELHGVDAAEDMLAGAGGRGIRVARLELERERLPYPDRSFDVVIANQVLEHMKDIFWVVGEASRVLVPGGSFIVGVPNLAAWHNRVALLFGRQPWCVGVLGPHVRGFCRPSLVEFLGAGGYFTVAESRGSNMYPFPPFLARILARLLPSLAVSLFVRSERTARAGSFVEVLKEHHFETSFFAGPGAP